MIKAYIENYIKKLPDTDLQLIRNEDKIPRAGGICK
jgi:hypothetical protein